jgi:hypothetical protein
MATTNVSYGTSSNLTVTGLASLANSSTAGWQSDLIDNRTTKALDYLIEFTLPMANTAAANDKAVYVYASPAYHDGTSWFYTDGGTTTLPSGANSAYTIGASTNLVPLKSFAYVATNSTIQGTISLSQSFGPTIPHGFSLIIVNYSGAAMAASGAAIKITPVVFTSA